MFPQTMQGLSAQQIAQRFAAMSLREQFLFVAQQRVNAGLAPYDYTPQGFAGQEVRESAELAAQTGDQPVSVDGQAVAVRESASMSDMPTLLGTQLYREIDDWFKQYAGQWQQYSKRVECVDFRQKYIAFVNELDDALEVRSERDIQDTGMLDKSYNVMLKRYARQITLPFTVIENDDKGFVKQIPQKMIRAADRTIQKIVVRNTLEQNPNAYDGAALFSANRYAEFAISGLVDSGATVSGNLISGTASGFDKNNLQAGIAWAQAATGDPDLNPSGVPLDIPAKYLVVPTTLEFNAAQTLNSAFLLAAASVVNNTSVTSGTPPLGVVGAQNPLQMGSFQTPVTLLVERYLTNATAWYLLPESEAGPITVAVRQGRGLRPRVWVNVPQRQAIMGGSADDYLLSVGDVVYGFSFDLNKKQAVNESYAA